MRSVALFFIALLAGCAHTHTTVSSGSGTTATGASVSLHGHGHGVAALVVAGLFIAAAADYLNNPYAVSPEMDAGRRVNEQDCSKPVDLSAGNLKCR